MPDISLLWDHNTPLLCKLPNSHQVLSVVNSYIALRSIVFLFNSLIFFTSFDIYHYYHSCLASEFLPDLIGEYKEFFMELFYFNFSYFVILSFLRLEEL